jgi:putative RNA 2'-phosphotransferase
MAQDPLVRVSKYLSKHLRHDPGRLGLTLAPGGWVEVEALLSACARNGVRISRAQLEEVVRGSDKQRFAFDETGTKIRANQGHTVAVDLQLTPMEPPDSLFHGTGEQTVAAIERHGLLKMARHHVHLSLDLQTAIKVGERHGRAAVFVVASGRMHADGATFYCSANGVWLVDHVPAAYLQSLTRPR